jgi:hypothetical protein
MLIPTFSQTQAVEVSLQPVRGLKGESLGQIGKDYRSDSAMVYNLEAAAIATLNADYAWMVARKVGAFVAKKVVADQIRQKNEALGLLADIAMQVSDRADLRNWSLLPSTIQVARISVPPGFYRLNLQGLNAGGQETLDRQEVPEIMIRGGQKVFYAWRSLR